MLGRLRRTSRLDVTLALVLGGVSYLVWVLVAGTTRTLIQEMISTHLAAGIDPPHFTKVVKLFFVDAGIAIDIAGLAWMAGTLLLIALSSRQKISISWAWVCSLIQVMLATLGAVLVAWAVFMPQRLPIDVTAGQTAMEKVSGFSLPVVLAIALVVWILFMMWLLADYTRFNRTGPTLSDGLRSNVFKFR